MYAFLFSLKNKSYLKFNAYFSARIYMTWIYFILKVKKSEEKIKLLH